MEKQKILEVKNLSYSYPSEQTDVLKDISFDVLENECFSIIGPSGCGKTTLVQTLNGIIPNSMKGSLRGEILLKNRSIKNISTAELSQEIQILFQSSESQLFALNVQDEISFGPENLKIPWDEIVHRIDDILKKLNIFELKNKSIEELSSGQKQKVALASVLVMKPKILVLDEPTANLDPVAVKILVKILKEIKKDITVIIIEHNLDFINELSDRVALMDKGQIITTNKPESIFQDPEFLKIMNPPKKFSTLIDNVEKLTTKTSCTEPILEIKDLNYNYSNNTTALRNINLTIQKAEFLGIVGMNGSGKSTLALNIIGLLKGNGKIFLNGINITKQSVFERTKNIGYVFQNPNYQLFEDKTWNEIAFGLKNIETPDYKLNEKIQKALNMIGLLDYSNEDPSSLSFGQKKRITIASIVAMEPKIIIIDEPDTGLDYKNAQKIMDHIKLLNGAGHTMIVVSHNLELLSDYCNRLIYLENGELKPIKNYIGKITAV